VLDGLREHCAHTHSRRQITRRRTAPQGSWRRKECGAGDVRVKALMCHGGNRRFVRIGVTGGRSPGGALAEGSCRRRDAAQKIRGSKGRSPWSAGMQGAIAQWPLARRRHNEIERGQKGTTVFVEAGCNRALSLGVAIRARKQRGERGTLPGQADESIAHIAFPPPDHPKGSWRRKECGAGYVLIKAPMCHGGNGRFVRIGGTGGRSPGGALRRREAAAEGTPRMIRRGSRTSAVRRAQRASLTDEDSRAEAKPPWNAGVQGVFVTTPPARRRHNEIGRNQQRTTVFVEAGCNRALPLPPHPPHSPFFFQYGFWVSSNAASAAVAPLPTAVTIWRTPPVTSPAA